MPELGPERVEHGQLQLAVTIMMGTRVFMRAKLSEMVLVVTSMSRSKGSTLRNATPSRRATALRMTSSVMRPSGPPGSLGALRMLNRIRLSIPSPQSSSTPCLWACSRMISAWAAEISPSSGQDVQEIVQGIDNSTIFEIIVHVAPSRAWPRSCPRWPWSNILREAGWTGPCPRALPPDPARRSCPRSSPRL